MMTVQFRLILTILKIDRLFVPIEGANTDHPPWALVLYTRAAVFVCTIMFVALVIVYVSL